MEKRGAILELKHVYYLPFISLRGVMITLLSPKQPIEVKFLSEMIKSKLKVSSPKRRPRKALQSKEFVFKQYNEPFYNLHISFTRSNCFLTLGTASGITITARSAGKLLHSTEKTGVFTVREMIENLTKVILKGNYTPIKLIISGNQQGSGLEQMIAIVEELETNGIVIQSFNVKSEMPHNGCKLPKRRRV